MKSLKRRILSVICIFIISVVSIREYHVFAETFFRIDLNQLNGKLVIIYTNDTHGFLLEDSERSLDAASLVTIKKVFESLGAEVLLFDVGDTIFGTPMFDKNLGPRMVELINEIGYDAITTGNHDFDYGSKKLEDIASMLELKPVVANLFYTATKKPVFDQYRLIKKADNCVGIFGITTPEEIKGFERYGDDSMILTDPIEEAKEAAKTLRKEGADYIIALGHIGMDQRSELSSLDVISEVPEIDLFIDGHSHSSLKLRMVHEDGSQTLLVRNQHYFSEIGVVVVNEDHYMQAYTIKKSDMENFIEDYKK